MALRICKPGLGGPPLPLMEAAEENSTQSEDILDETESDLEEIINECLEEIDAEGTGGEGTEEQPEGSTGEVPPCGP
jgi:hypothetical protein